MRVLIVKTSSMGDVLHTLPALTDAQQAIPGIKFDWVVEEGFAQIPSWHAAVERVIPVAIRRWRKAWMTLNSLVSGGCVISGSVVVQSVLFSRVRVNSFCNIDSAVLLPEVWVGRSCRLRRCVIDRACVIPEGMVIGENAEEDARRFYRSEEGIVLVTREMLRKLGHKQER